MTELDIMLAMSRHYDYFRNIIVPNISYGINMHECDMLVVSKVGYLTEIEIKISKNDLIQDKKKRHGHADRRIKTLYFAMPEKLKNCIEHVPERSGIFLVKDEVYSRYGQEVHHAECIRSPVSDNFAKKISDELRCEIYRLGCIRIWKLYQTIYNMKKYSKEV